MPRRYRSHTLPQLLREYALREGRKRVVPLTASEIARRLGVSRAAVSAWMTGVRTPSEDAVASIAELLGVSEQSVARIVDDQPKEGKEG